MTGEAKGYDLEDIVACLDREVRMRKRIYPGRVRHHRMTQAAADREIAIMEQVLKTAQAALAANIAGYDLFID
jgi:hypothetical protein